MTRRGIRRLAALAGIVTIAAAVLAGVFIVRSSARAARVEEAYATGMKLYQAAGDQESTRDAEYAAALPHLGTAIAGIKNDPELLKAYAVCRAAVELPNGAHLQRAIGVAKAAVSLAPADLEAKAILLDLYWELAYLTELVDLADRMLTADPTLYEPRTRRIEALQYLGRNEESMADADALIEHHPESLDAHRKWDAVASRNSRSDLVRVTHARELKEQFGSDPNYLSWLSQLEAVGNNIDRSIAAAREAAQQPPVSAQQVSDLVDWLRDLNRSILARDPEAELGEPTLLELADTLFARAIEDPELGPAVAGQATRRTWWANRTDRAREFATRIGSEPDPLEAWWASLVLIGEQPRMGEAMQSETVAPLASVVTESAWTELLAAMDRLRAGENESVAKSLSSFSARDTESRAVADYLRGVALYRMGDYRGASLSLRAAAEAGGISRDRAWKALGDAYAADGSLDRAITAYGSMSDRSSIPGLDRLDNVLTRAEQVGDPLLAREALDVLRGIAERTESDPTLDVRLARAMVLGGETEQGIELARRLLNSDPPPDPMGTIGLVRSLQIYAPELSNEMLASMTTRTESIELLAVQAVTLAQAGRLDEGRAMLMNEIEQRDLNEALPYRRALVRLLDDAETDDAMEVAIALSDDYPESGAAQLGALRTRAIWGDLDAARLAISRLRNAVGEESLAWQTFNARATIEGEPTDEELSRILTEELGRLLREAPDDFDALMLTARAYCIIANRHAAAGREDEASRSIDQAAQYYDRATGPGLRVFAFKPFIEMLREQNRRVEAARALDRFAAVDELPFEGRYQRRNLLLEAGRFSEAAVDQRNLAGYDVPKSVLDLASMHLRAGESREAVEVVNDFLDHQDWDPDNLEAAANLLAEAGALARSLEVFGQLPDPHNGTPRDAVIARTLMRVGRQRDAFPYQLSAARRTGTPESWVSAIRVAGAIGDDALLNSTVDEAMEALPDSPEIAAYASENPLRAFSLGIANQAGRDDVPGWGSFRDTTLAHGRGSIDDQELLDRLAQICRDHPELIEAWRTRIDAYFLLSRPDDGIAVARAATDAMPRATEPLRLLVETLRQTGRIDEAIEPAERLVRMTAPDNFRATVILALLEADRGNFQRVIDLLSGYRDRLESDSLDQPSAGFTALAVAFAGLGNAPEASAMFMSRLESGSVAWQNTAMLATIALPNDRLNPRREWLAMISAENFARAKAGQYIVLARFSGKAEDAEQALAVIETHGRETSDWLWIRSQAESLAGQGERSEATLNRLRELEPDAAIVPAALGELLSTMDHRAEDAIVALDEAIRLAGADAAGFEPGIRVSRARALLSLAQPEAALDQLAPLLESESPPANALVLAGRSHLLLGSLNRAAEAEEKARNMTDLDAQTQADLDALRRALN